MQVETRAENTAKSPEIKGADASDVIPLGVRKLIGVFADDGALSFPDVSRESLEERSEEVRAAGSAVDALLEELQRARAALEEAQTRLLDHAEQALAYARIYAATRPELLGSLEGIRLRASKSPRPSAGKKRPRKAKQESQLSLASESGDGSSACAATASKDQSPALKH
jgi:hypothetical protein